MMVPAGIIATKTVLTPKGLDTDKKPSTSDEKGTLWQKNYTLEKVAAHLVSCNEQGGDMKHTNAQVHVIVLSAQKNHLHPHTYYWGSNLGN